MFWLINKKIKFSLHTLNLSPFSIVPVLVESWSGQVNPWSWLADWASSSKKKLSDVAQDATELNLLNEETDVINRLAHA